MHSSYTLWLKSIVLGCILIAIGFVYVGIQTSLWTMFSLNKSLAYAAIIMIDLSFVVSGTSYFWSLGTKYMGFRKSVGVVGFVLGLFHAFLSAWLYTGSIVLIALVSQSPLTYIPALTAILIFTMMVAVSNGGMPVRLGAKRWRQLLRVGYIGILLLVVHMSIQAWDQWIYWLTAFDSLLPPLSLIVVLFSLFTLILRIFLFFALRRKERKNNTY